ncbi:MAG: hypothetical protein ACE5FO_03950 [Parvularculaceae bacterium]
MSKEGGKKPVTLTRKELYAQVWRKPMSRLAAEYGLSGNGLAKICDRHKIPYPPRGHWAKKAAGKKVITYRAHSEKWEPVFGYNARQNKNLEHVLRLAFRRTCSRLPEIEDGDLCNITIWPTPPAPKPPELPPETKRRVDAIRAFSVPCLRILVPSYGLQNSLFQ